MSDREGIFAGEDPFAIAASWLAAAAETEPNDPNAMTLATVDGDGMPNVRVVLLKDISDGGLVFFTNHDSAKGRELDGAGKSALNFHWKTLGRQMRFRGSVARVPGAESDAYYATRALESRLGAWASRQSRPLADRATLMAAVQTARATHGATPARPPHWGGYRLTPREIEFWADGAFRLHDRFRWTRNAHGAGWDISRLNP